MAARELAPIASSGPPNRNQPTLRTDQGRSENDEKNPVLRRLKHVGYGADEVD
jgi:hypothetical protein